MKKGLKVVLIGALVCGLSSIVMARNNNACEIPTDIQERYDVIKANIENKVERRNFEKRIAQYWGGCWGDAKNKCIDEEKPYLHSDCDVLEKEYRKAYQKVYDTLSMTNSEEKLYDKFQGTRHELNILYKATFEGDL